MRKILQTATLCQKKIGRFKWFDFLLITFQK